MDCCCFFDAILSIVESDGVVEGGNGAMAEHEEIEKCEAETTQTEKAQRSL